MTDGPRQDSDSRALAGSGTAAIIRGPADVSRSEIFMECHTRCEEPVTVRGVCVGMLAEQNDQRPRADATPSPGWLAFWPAVPKPRSRLLPPALFSSQCGRVEGRVSSPLESRGLETWEGKCLLQSRGRWPSDEPRLAGYKFPIICIILF